MIPVSIRVPSPKIELWREQKKDHQLGAIQSKRVVNLCAGYLNHRLACRGLFLCAEVGAAVGSNFAEPVHKMAHEPTPVAGHQRFIG